MTTAHSAAIKRSAQARPGLRMIVAAKSAASVEESCAATAKFREEFYSAYDDAHTRCLRLAAVIWPPMSEQVHVRKLRADNFELVAALLARRGGEAPKVEWSQVLHSWTKQRPLATPSVRDPVDSSGTASSCPCWMALRPRRQRSSRPPSKPFTPTRLASEDSAATGRSA